MATHQADPGDDFLQLSASAKHGSAPLVDP